MLLLSDQAVDVGAVRRAVELLVTCARARDRGTTDRALVGRRLPPGVVGVAGVVPDPGPEDTAVDALRAATRLVEGAGPA